MAWLEFIVITVALIVFFIYSALAVNHARKFRYISTRTLFLTKFYIASTASLVFIVLILAIFVVKWN